MKGVLLDTHAWAWSLTADPRLTAEAQAIMTAAPVVYVSPISFFEIGQKVRLGKWPEMAPWVEKLPDLLEEQGGQLATFTARIALGASMADWPHRDPVDRILAATARHLDVPLVSADLVFDGEVERVW